MSLGGFSLPPPGAAAGPSSLGLSLLPPLISQRAGQAAREGEAGLEGFPRCTALSLGPWAHGHSLARVPPAALPQPAALIPSSPLGAEMANPGG